MVPTQVCTRRWLLGGLLSSTLACLQAPHQLRVLGSSKSFSPRPLVVVVAIDGVRWQDVFCGPEATRAPELGHFAAEEWTPHLSQLRNSGAVYGAPGAGSFKASGPNFVSLPGYMEILSGSSRVPCTENDCPRMERRTLLDEFTTADANDISKAAVFSSWERVAAGAALSPRSGVISTGRFDGRQLQVLDQWPETRRWQKVGHSEVGGEDEFRYDQVTGNLALAYLKNAAPDFLFLALGETDEAAHRGDYRGYLEALRCSDKIVGSFRDQLSVLERQGRETLIFVTTDHGRAQHFTDHGREFPESADSFLLVGGSLVKNRGQLIQKNAFLADIAPTIRDVSGLPQSYEGHQGRVLSELFA